jgi:hypothetical protein
MNTSGRTRNFAIVTGADEPEIFNAADKLRELGVTVQAVETDLSTAEGVCMAEPGSGEKK